ncbi:AAA family ATPase [Microbacterium sp.]|uniref:ATP-dependent nuclease n=1 Tax=Microbacterium sp. TaxID=51671 RepID=UPI00262BD4DD|nr:AAA family ATPase [Microbacterium sp.]
MSPDELKKLSVILQREYRSVRLVKHDLFNVEGYTAALSVDGRKYSEAYAGSGEFAAIMLVRSISRAAHRSLILLDEPETSLHPGAQRELMRFIAMERVAKKHQVVLATHAPSMVTDLPDEGRKLLDLDPVSGRVRVVTQKASSDESFSRIGAQIASRTIVVEDDLAVAVVRRACRLRGDDFLGSVSIAAVPGGAETLARRVVAVQAPLHASCVVIFDGDARPTESIRDSAEVTDAQLQSELDKIGLKKEALLRNGGDGDQTEHLIAVRRQALEWVNSHVDYLPGDFNPEALLLEMSGRSHAGNEDAKKQWETFTRDSLNLLESEHVTSPQILDEQIRTLASLSDDNPQLIAVLNTLETLLAEAERADRT